MKKETAYNQIEKLALPFIEAFHDDLFKHDKNCIESHNIDTPFLHFTGSTGTHIVMMEPYEEYPGKNIRVPYIFGSADRWQILDGKNQWLNVCRSVIDRI